MPTLTGNQRIHLNNDFAIVIYHIFNCLHHRLNDSHDLGRQIEANHKPQLWILSVFCKITMIIKDNAILMTCILCSGLIVLCVYCSQVQFLHVKSALWSTTSVSNAFTEYSTNMKQKPGLNSFRSERYKRNLMDSVLIRFNIYIW